MDDCLFCKIVKGEIPSKKVYEDEKVYAFYDIEPAAPGHFLVIPKEVTEENRAIIGYIYQVIAKLARELKLDKGYRVVTNCGEDAGQTVQHIHFHVLAGGPLGKMA